MMKYQVKVQQYQGLSRFSLLVTLYARLQINITAEP